MGAGMDFSSLPNLGSYLWPSNITSAAHHLYAIMKSCGAPNLNYEDFIEQVLTPFSLFLANLDIIGDDHPMLCWARYQEGSFLELRFLCTKILKLEPRCVNQDDLQSFWPMISLMIKIDPVYDNEDPAFLVDKMEQAKDIFTWMSKAKGITTKREDPKKFVIQPDQLVVDPVCEPSDFNDVPTSTVPVIPLDFDSEESAVVFEPPTMAGIRCRT